MNPLAQVAHWCRRRNASNAAAFEGFVEARFTSAGRPSQVDTDVPGWLRLGLRVWNATYRRYGIALPVPPAFRRRANRSEGSSAQREPDPVHDVAASAGRETPTVSGLPDFARLASLSEQEWFEEVVADYRADGPARGVLSGYPDAALQTRTVGSSGPAALTQPYRFWVDVRRACHSLGAPIGPSSRVLDFGCGWGRVTRFFFKDTQPENVLGIDVDPDFVAICQRTMSGGSYEVVQPLPPTHLSPGSFDLVIAYSVFSHLAEHAARAWMKEFARVLRSGGVVAVTTRSRDFLASPHLKTLGGMFPDLDEARRRYDEGEFLYAAAGGGGVRDSSYYGEAFIPEGYARQAWAPDLELREFRFDRVRQEMALLLLQKPAPADEKLGRD